MKKKLSLLLSLLTVIPAMSQQTNPGASPSPDSNPSAVNTKQRTPKPAPAPRTPDSAVTPVDDNPKDKVRHAQCLARKSEGDIGLLFLGDSITDLWPKRGPESWAKFAPYHPADFGVSSDTTDNVLWRITNGELDGIHPKVVVIMIGTNNIGHYKDEKPEWAAAGIKKIVEIVHQKLPNAKVLLLAVFPRGANSEDPLRLRNDEVNKLIAKLDDGDKTRYLDIGHVFLTPDGQLSKDIMPDHLHPSAKGYDLWYNAIRPPLDQMMQ